MELLKLLTKLAENAHHQIAIEELIKDQPNAVREAMLGHKNAQLRGILGGSNINFPDRDKVVTIHQEIA